MAANPKSAKPPPEPTEKVVREYDRLLEVVRAGMAAGHNTDEAEGELRQFMADNPGLGEGGFLPESPDGDPE